MNYVPSRIFYLRNNLTDAGNVEVTQNEFGPVTNTIDARSMGVLFFLESSLELGKDQRGFFADPRRSAWGAVHALLIS